MSSMYHEVLGSFADVPAVIRVNGASLDSTVSLSFLHNFNVPRSICNHDGVAAESSSGPVRVPTVDSWFSGTNWSYVNTKDGQPFKTNIIGQIATSTCGTRHSAKGMHFTKKARSTPLTQLIFGLTLAIKECTSERLGHRQMEVGTLEAHFMFAQLGRHLGKPTDVYRRLGD
jgi:hypothetical protein